MRLVRAAGQNVSPSDDGRLYDQIFSDGLFTETSFASLGADSVRIGAMYGDLCGRDFTIEQQTITVQLPEGEGETTGYIYVEIDLSAETPLSVGSALAPFTPTYEDINVNGAVCQMIVAEYTATALAVTSVTAVYEKAAASSVKAGSIATVENSTATEAHDVGEYVLINGQMYIVTAAVSIGETFIEGTNISAVSIGDELTALNAGLIASHYESNGIGLDRFGNMRSITFFRATLGNVKSFITSLPSTDYPRDGVTYNASLFKTYLSGSNYIYAGLGGFSMKRTGTTFNISVVTNTSYNSSNPDSIVQDNERITGQIMWFTD